ncbi:hypothetical protein LAW88_22600, partial [Escherichia coli]|nr:hypothetical protein [Escherichia coli]MDD9009806.1 hypothetical protein [Escherichia coli]
RLRFSGPKTSIICSPMTSLKTSIKTITYLSDIGCLEIQGASLWNNIGLPVNRGYYFSGFNCEFAHLSAK